MDHLYRLYGHTLFTYCHDSHAIPLVDCVSKDFLPSRTQNPLNLNAISHPRRRDLIV